MYCNAPVNAIHIGSNVGTLYTLCHGAGRRIIFLFSLRIKKIVTDKLLFNHPAFPNVLVSTWEDLSECPSVGTRVCLPVCLSVLLDTS